MKTVSIPIERLMFGNEHWRSHLAIDEVEVYCDLLDQTRKETFLTTTTHSRSTNRSKAWHKLMTGGGTDETV